MRLGLALALTILVSRPVRADNQAAAEALFLDGEQLAKAGNYAAACPKFEASVALDPALGARIHLADCHEHLGRTATAWAEYHAIEELAGAKGDSARKTIAHDHAAALSTRLIRLRLDAPAPPIAGLVVHRDGDDVTALLGEAVPVDPGDHTIEASAPGHASWKQTATLVEEGTTRTLAIPTLAAVAEVAPIDRAPAVASTATVTAPTLATTAVVAGPTLAKPRHRIGLAVLAGMTLSDLSSNPGKGVLPGIFIGGRASIRLSRRWSIEPGLDLNAAQTDVTGTIIPATQCPGSCKFGLWDIEIPAYLRAVALEGPTMLSVLAGAYGAYRAHFGGADVAGMAGMQPISTGAASVDAGLALGLELFVGRFGGQLTFQQGLVQISDVITTTSQRMVFALGSRW